MPRFVVHISDEGSATIDGELLVPETSQSVHEAVLDRLQWYATEAAAVVNATVNDPSTGHFAMEVSPDGSSRILTDPPDTDAPEGTASTLAPTPAAVGTSDAAAPMLSPVHAPTVVAAVPAPSAIATAVARAAAAAQGAIQRGGGLLRLMPGQSGGSTLLPRPGGWTRRTRSRPSCVRA